MTKMEQADLVVSLAQERGNRIQRSPALLVASLARPHQRKAHQPALRMRPTDVRQGDDCDVGLHCRPTIGVMSGQKRRDGDVLWRQVEQSVAHAFGHQRKCDERGDKAAGVRKDRDIFRLEDSRRRQGLA